MGILDDNIVQDEHVINQKIKCMVQYILNQPDASYIYTDHGFLTNQLWEIKDNIIYVKSSIPGVINTENSPKLVVLSPTGKQPVLLFKNTYITDKCRLVTIPSDVNFGPSQFGGFDLSTYDTLKIPNELKKIGIQNISFGPCLNNIYYIGFTDNYKPVLYGENVQNIYNMYLLSIDNTTCMLHDLSKLKSQFPNLNYILYLYVYNQLYLDLDDPYKNLPIKNIHIHPNYTRNLNYTHVFPTECLLILKLNNKILKLDIFDLISNQKNTAIINNAMKNFFENNHLLNDIFIHDNRYHRSVSIKKILKSIKI